MLGYVISFVVAVAISVLVNWLAFVLPGWALTMQDAGESGGDAPAAEGPDTNKVQSPAIFSLRTIASTLFMCALVIYLYASTGFSATMWILTIYSTVFMLVAIIDIEHRLILDVVMLPAFVFAIIEVLVSPRMNWMDGLVGYAIAQIVVMAFYVFGAAYLWLINRKRTAEMKVDEVAFGFGDVTLATFCGLVVGFPSVIVMLGLMVLIGAANSILYLLITGLFTKEYKAHTALPYGPAILLAAVIMLLWGDVVARALGAN